MELVHTNQLGHTLTYLDTYRLALYLSSRYVSWFSRFSSCSQDFFVLNSSGSLPRAWTHEKSTCGSKHMYTCQVIEFVTFMTPCWSSLNHWKGHLIVPKNVTKNCQVDLSMLNACLFQVILHGFYHGIHHRILMELFPTTLCNVYSIHPGSLSHSDKSRGDLQLGESAWFWLDIADL